MVSFANLPSLRFPAQNRLSLEGLEAIGRARQRKRDRERQNRMLDEEQKRKDEEKKREDQELALRKRQTDLLFELARQRAGPRMLRPSFAGLSFGRVAVPHQTDLRAPDAPVEGSPGASRMMRSPFPQETSMSFRAQSNEP